ncbi:MAG: hypothetical protein EA401_11845 [Planctomycetota bacterium]|nr:MAG: hypothetical protein EA401_11845 [Planctomycetota bacterium]
MEPSLQREGNLRLVSQTQRGWPFDYRAAIASVDEAIAAANDSDIRGYGPVQIFISLPPDDPDPATWDLQVGRACLGIPRIRAPLSIEDYHGLVAIHVPHLGPVRDLHRSHRLVADHARAQGARLRPYWRVRLQRQATPDGQGMVTTDVSVFTDR